MNAVYRSMAQYEDGTWFLDNLKAKARVNKLLAAAASSSLPAEPPPVRCLRCAHYGNVVDGKCREIGSIVVQGGEATTHCDCECVFPAESYEDMTMEIAPAEPLQQEGEQE